MYCNQTQTYSLVFLSQLPTFGLIGLICIGITLYFSYILSSIIYHRRYSSFHLISLYIILSKIGLFCLLLTPITFIFRPNFIVCLVQTLSIQIIPFVTFVSFNLYFIHKWLTKWSLSSSLKMRLTYISVITIGFLCAIVQSSIILSWLYYTKPVDNYNCPTHFNLSLSLSFDDDDNQNCNRQYYLCSLIFNFLLLFAFSLQSSIRYHIDGKRKDFFYLLSGLSSICVTIIWISFYFFHSKTSIYFTENYILAYGQIFLGYCFLIPLLFEQLFYRKQKSSHHNISKKHLTSPITTIPQISQSIVPLNNRRKIFKCLSLTKEQQRAFMAAYVKRNLTASCENLTTMTTTTRSSSSSTISPKVVNNVIVGSPVLSLYDNNELEQDNFNDIQSNINRITHRHYLSRRSSASRDSVDSCPTFKSTISDQYNQQQTGRKSIATYYLQNEPTPNTLGTNIGGDYNFSVNDKRLLLLSSVSQNNENDQQPPIETCLLNSPLQSLTNTIDTNTSSSKSDEDNRSLIHSNIFRQNWELRPRI
ncbi:unnamed protein product [Didymodactylos carnosus]|uniref:G-protein coupled receptors family 3 profile domain-containing protein n=1 Tax=Didymodactylos carnosus TaxID=1234261 RepID=A0A813T4A3_9BILA|nr:unnamed protein product [Didymodactylos carnosus]CAF0933654.1 unnamed protein product [Didymodactylos carnosus]CAF3589365.1 unnamed protein product [Didymodactylos carnosus]CAF3709692.1 unnamed protein product [Didymodactylos carnosus]